MGSGPVLLLTFAMAVTGHKGFIGEFGADMWDAPLSPIRTITVGPRVSWASGNYMEEYFSVKRDESGASWARSVRMADPRFQIPSVWKASVRQRLQMKTGPLKQGWL